MVTHSLGCVPHFHQNGHSPAKSLTGRFFGKYRNARGKKEGRRATQESPPQRGRGFPGLLGKNLSVGAHQTPPAETELDAPVIRRSDEALSRYG